MTGKTDLDELLRELQPALNEGEYAWCTLEPATTFPAGECIASFCEQEGVSVIAPRRVADEHGWPYSFLSAWITLTVHSSLEAVGLTAAVSRALADAGISCNIVAAYYHDHLFVPLADAAAALRVLQSLAGGAPSGPPTR
jgi:hypothetical protein